MYRKQVDALDTPRKQPAAAAAPAAGDDVAAAAPGAGDELDEDLEHRDAGDVEATDEGDEALDGD